MNEEKRVLSRNETIFFQKKAAAALKEEFGFAPARLNEIMLLKADNFGFDIHFRVGNRYYTYRNDKIERTDDAGFVIEKALSLFGEPR